MFHKSALVAALLLALCPLAQAENAPAAAAPAAQAANTAPQDSEDQISTYFRNPAPERALKLLLRMADKPIFQNKAPDSI